jgi:tetratricopeptide (TPR) repeat protein
MYNKTKQIIRSANRLFVVLIVLTAAFLLTTSCNQSGSSAPGMQKQQQSLARLTQKAHRTVASQPDSALIFADSAIVLVIKLKVFNSDTLFSLFEIKAKANINLGVPDSAIAAWEKLRLLAINNSDTTLQAGAALRAGEIALNQSNIFYAEEFLLEAVSLYEKKRDSLGMGIAYRTFGNLLASKEDYKQAQYYGLKAYGIFQSLHRLRDLGSVCINIGNVFNATGSRAEELRYNREALRFASQVHDTANLISVLNNMGLYFKKSYPDSAIWYYQKALSLNSPGTPISDVLHLKYNMANLYYRKNDLQKALVGYKQILEISKSENLYSGTIMASLGISSVYVKLGDFQKSFQTLTGAERLADSIGDISLKMTVMDAWREHYQEQGNYKESYRLLTLLKTHQDSTLDLDKQVAIHEMEKVLQTQKKDAENQQLTAEVETKDQNLRSRSYIILLLTLVALLSLFFSWKGYSLYRERSYAYNVLMKKYEDEKAQRNLAESLQQDDSREVKLQISKSADDPLIENLIQYYHDVKPYLDPKLRADDVAAKLNTTQKAIAAALKQFNNSNFNTFTNQYRIEEAKRIMENLSDSFYKVESVAYDSGFGSKSSFYVAFEQFTGVKPSYYRSFMLDRKADAS